MGDFTHKLLRLKQVLGVTEDREVAEALGMTKAAFSERKRRDSFPEDKLRALVSRRPNLALDPQYVLTGARSGSSPVDAPVPQRVAKIVEGLKLGQYRPPIDSALFGRCIAAVDAGLARRGVKLDDEHRGRVYLGMYDLAVDSGNLTDQLVEHVVNLLPQPPKA